MKCLTCKNHEPIQPAASWVYYCKAYHRIPLFPVEGFAEACKDYQPKEEKTCQTH